ncbi:putative disease resistance RPP13-like protein 1 [Cajanus cajan]|uniref:putative disease resistance RPP13-like protein 1 n=1 Tax=Cajanus cajan TaxID=3821 RepID=UPI0010FB780A|nr:putative disease resistance RPP13-like protein 1 [Cajanus cajan]
MPVEEVFLSAFLQVLFDRLATKNVIEVILAGDKGKILKKFQKTLLLIKAVLNDAEDKHVKNDAVRMWLVDLKDVAFDAEDILDKFATEVLKKRLESISQSQVQTTFTRVCNLIPTSLNPSNLMFDVEIELKIKAITERLETLANERHELGLSEVAARCSFKINETSSTVNESYIYGRDKDKDKIIQLLMENRPSHGDEVLVIPIVGMPGIGKTTLAQVVFNDDKVNTHFELKAWVSIPDDFDVKVVTGKILESATSITCDFNNLHQLQIKLKAALSGKKFLIVLDDVWNKNYNEWIKLVAPFRGAARGSSVIVTTRSAEVANMMGTVECHYVNQLSDEDCESVFMQHAFRSKTIDANHAFTELGKKIARKCKGSPLTATTLGGNLSSQRDVREWENVMDFEIWDLAVEESNILQTLRLSYNQLPPYLKPCFAYCSILPKGFEFEEKELVLLWMAEGLLEQQSQKQLEDIGHEYFQELLSASLFQRSTSNRSLYVMHDLINDLAQWVAGESCFKLDNHVHPHRRKKKKISKRTRYVSYIGGEYDGIQMFQALKEAKSLRTFLPLKHSRLEEWSYITNHVPFELLPELRCLRALSLSGYFITKLPNSVSNLNLLRYLNLSWTDLRQLPESICSLCNLQTLLLRDCFNLEQLPSNLSDLINLRHLDITRAHSLTDMPHGIGKLTHLRTLTDFIVGSSGIGELMKLINIQGVLSVSRLENVSDTLEASGAMLNKKVGIDVLKLKWSFMNNQSHIERAKDVLHMLKPHKGLAKLTIKCYGGTSFPKWIGDPSYKSLVFLKLKDCANCTSLPALGNLHALKELYIIGMKEVCCIDGGFYGNACFRPFPSLEKLHFMDMEKWENWFLSDNNEQRDIFSSLQQIFIVRCPKLLGKLPENLPSLKHVLVKECEQFLVTIATLPMLYTLEIEGCKGLVLNCANEFNSLNSMSVSRILELTLLMERLVEAFKNVEELKIVSCALDEIVLNDLWGNEVWLEKNPHVFSSKLKLIEIRNCNVMRSVPKVLMVNSHCLERLYICNCDSLVFITMDQFPPSLKSLEISNCKNLRCLLENGTSSSSSIIMHDDNVQQSGRNHRIISHLEYVYIGWCPSLTCISRSNELPESVKLLFIWNCLELSCLSMKDQLPKSLEKLEIQNCPKLKSIANRRRFANL